jgi:hypothetical protein
MPETCGQMSAHGTAVKMLGDKSTELKLALDDHAKKDLA